MRASLSRATRWRAASPRASPTPPSEALWSTQAPRPRALASTCKSPSRPSSPTSPCECHIRGSIHRRGGERRGGRGTGKEEGDGGGGGEGKEKTGEREEDEEEEVVDEKDAKNDEREENVERAGE